MMTCKKYILDTNYADDTNYLSHVDGRLYVVSMAGDPYDHDQYCIEYKNASGNIVVSLYMIAAVFCFGFKSKNLIFIYSRSYIYEYI